MKTSFISCSSIQLEAELEQVLHWRKIKGSVVINKTTETISLCVRSKDELEAIRVVARKHPDFKHVETFYNEEAGLCTIEFR